MAWRNILKQTQRYLDRVQNPYQEGEKLLYSFASQEDLQRWTVFSDQEYGGKSAADLALSASEPEHAVFEGSISSELAGAEEASKRMQRSGFAGFNTEDMQGHYLDMEGADCLSFRLKGDGRKYMASVRVDNWIVGETSHDVWQAFLFARKGGWQDVIIPMDRFLQTHKGRLVETRSEMNIHRILSLGISIASLGDVEQDGPFSLGIQNIKAKMLDVTPLDD